jgi:hypothetical protein
MGRPVGGHSLHRARARAGPWFCLRDCHGAGTIAHADDRCARFLGFCRLVSWVWWTPAAVFAIAMPLMLMKVGAINSWRSEAGLATYGAPETVLNMLITLVLYYVAYGIGFGAAQLFRDRARP